MRGPLTVRTAESYCSSRDAQKYHRLQHEPTVCVKQESSWMSSLTIAAREPGIFLYKSITTYQLLTRVSQRDPRCLNAEVQYKGKLSLFSLERFCRTG